MGDVEEIPPRHVLDDQVEEPIGVFPPIEDGDDAGVADAARGAASRRNRATASGWCV